MAELRDAASDVVYRPLSGRALGGLAISCLFGGVVALNASMAVLLGTPFFFSNWTLLLAIAGFVVSWWGMSDIRNSEGTKAGQKLATYGMWISLVSGTGYFAYSYFTGLALSQQALAFFLNEEDGFFTHLRKVAQDKTELNRAFLLTLPAPDRGGVNPADESKMVKSFDKPGQDGAPGNLSRFRSDHLVLGISKGGSAVSIESLGVHSWKFEQRSYHVTCLFRVKSPESIAEVGITVRSSEGEAEGQSRQWFVDMTNYSYRPLLNTPFGEGMARLRANAFSFAQSLEETTRRTGSNAGAFARLDKTDWGKLDPQVQQELKARVQGIFDGTDTTMQWHFQPPKEGMVTDWNLDAQGRLTLAMPLFLILADSTSQMNNRGELSITLQTKTAVAPEKLSNAEITDMPEWELKHFRATRLHQGGRK